MGSGKCYMVNRGKYISQKHCMPAVLCCLLLVLREGALIPPA